MSSHNCAVVSIMARVYPHIFRVSASLSCCEDGKVEALSFFTYFVWAVSDIFESNLYIKSNNNPELDYQVLFIVQ